MNCRPGWPRGRGYSPDVLARIAELAESDSAREVCGFVLERPDRTLEVVPVPNVADRLPDPGGLPHPERDSYFMDPLVELRILEGAASTGSAVAAVYHSHIDAAARFSSRDREGALLDGLQAIPGAEYLVVSVRGGAARETRRFVWDGRDFVLVALPGE